MNTIKLNSLDRSDPFVKQASVSLFSLLLIGLILTAPLNLFLKLSESFSFVNGLKVDYLILKWYISDFFVLGLGWFGLVQVSGQLRTNAQLKNQESSKKLVIRNKYMLWTGFTAFLVLGNILTSQVMAVTAWTWFKVVLLVLSGYAVWHHFPQLKRSKMVYLSLIGAILFQSILALVQFHLQNSVFPYSVFGETNLQAFAGVAKGSFFGELLTLPYGSTAHPNVLSGFLIGYWLLASFFFDTQAKTSQSQILNVLMWSLVTIVLGLTQSMAAWVAWVFATILVLSLKAKSLDLLKLQKSIVLVASVVFLFGPFFVAFLSSNYPLPFLERRAILNQAAIELTTRKPILGVGLEAITTQVEQVVKQREIVRFIQPTHHVGLLLLAEIGLAGLAWIAWSTHTFMFRYMPSALKTKWLASISWLSPIAAFDHYLLTLQSGRVLLMLTIVLCLGFNQDLEMQQVSGSGLATDSD